jgi:hypothetical protein
MSFILGVVVALFLVLCVHASMRRWSALGMSPATTMICPATSSLGVLRVARPTDQLDRISHMYQTGLGLSSLYSFKDHDGFDGVILGQPGWCYHLEFTHHKEGGPVGRAPTQDHLIALYLPDVQQWTSRCDAMISAGFHKVASYNPYWDVHGATFEDVDGYRVVLQNEAWAVDV